jgi:hypothetical protein
MVRLVFFTSSKGKRRYLSTFLKHNQPSEYNLKIILLTTPAVQRVHIYNTCHNDTLRCNVMESISKLLRDGYKVTVLVDKTLK